MATITKTIKSSGGDYTSLATALSTEVSSGSNIAGNEYVFSCDALVDSFGETTIGASWLIDKMTIRGPVHGGVRSSGYRATATGGWAGGFILQRTNVWFENIVFNGGGYPGTIAVRSTSGSVYCINCLAYGHGDQSFNSSGSSAVLYVINSIVYGGSADSCRCQNQGTFYGYNVTVLNSGAHGFFTQNYCTMVLKNCYAGGSATSDFAGDITPTMTNCHSSDATGNTQTSIANCHFTNSTAGSENAHIASNSSLVGVGADLRSDATYNVTTDFEGDTRAATPCVGADEYVASGSALTATLTESLGITDSTTQSIGRIRTLSESLGITDALTRAMSFFRTLTDTEGVDSQDFGSVESDIYSSLSDTVGITDSLTRVSSSIRLLSDTEGTSDSTSRVMTYIRSFSDSIGLTDLLEYILSGPGVIYRTISDAVGMSDSLSRIGEFIRIISTTAGIYDVLTRSMSYIRSLSDSMGLTDILQRIFPSLTKSYMTGEVDAQYMTGEIKQQ